LCIDFPLRNVELSASITGCFPSVWPYNAQPFLVTYGVSSALSRRFCRLLAHVVSVDDVPRECTTVRMYRLERNQIHVSLAETLHLRKGASPRGLSRRVPWCRRTDTSGGLFCNQSESSAPCFVGKLMQLGPSPFCVSSLDLNLA